MRAPESPSRTIDLRHAIAIGTPKAVELWLDLVDDPVERADQIRALDEDETRRFADLLSIEDAIEMVDTIDLHLILDLIRLIPRHQAAALLAALESDRATEILRELEPPEREPLLAQMPQDRAVALRALLTWPEESAAAHMVPDVVTVDDSISAARAIEVVRSHAARLRQDSHIGAYVFAIDGVGRLHGVVSFRELVLADPDTALHELVEHDVVTVGPLMDQEEAASILRRHRLLAIPVVDEERRLLGVITSDDASDIEEEEATEDAVRQGGSEPLDVPYMRASPWLLWRKRIVWLLVLFIAEMYTGSVMKAFEDELSTVTALAFFVPLLIGTGGNTGTQITTMLIRAMSTEGVKLRDVGRVLTKELSTGFFIAISMAIAGFIRAWTLGVEVQVMLTVAVALGCIILWSSLIASIIPLVLKKFRVDPAVVSGPMIATIVDGTGLLIYFMVAKALLPELAGL